MGLFSNNKKQCPICGEPTPRLFPTKVEGTPICKTCAGKIYLPVGMVDRMNLGAFKAYLTLYDDNASLREVFQPNYTYDVAGWTDQIDIDQTHGLFRLSNLNDSIVFPGSCIQSFQILEDSRALLEGDKNGLRVYSSEVPSLLNQLQPMLNQYQTEKREYERIKRMRELMNRDDDNDNDPYIPEPRFDPPKPVEKFHILMTMDHPYWTSFEGKIDGPHFGFGEPSLTEYMNQYREQANNLAQLAKNLMRLFAPGTPVQRVGSGTAVQTPAASPAAPAQDPVLEIQRYKALLDAGVITEAEFTTKKRQLLGI